jgi:hypothetical protein
MQRAGRVLVAATIVVLAGACVTAPADEPVGAEDVPVTGPGSTVCDDATASAIDATIGGQLAAFAADDFEGALDFASTGFRASIDVSSFRTLIQRDYPLVADATGHRSRECRQPDDTSAQVLVEVTGSSGLRGDLVYLLVAEEEGWRIAGASSMSRRDETVA